jgi:nitrite reductase/ring-hydroxylating ferredoxin subunit
MSGLQKFPSRQKTGTVFNVARDRVGIATRAAGPVMASVYACMHASADIFCSFIAANKKVSCGYSLLFLRLFKVV